MIFKLVVLVLLAFVVFSLASGLYFMLKDQGRGHRTAKALTFRISLSLGLFVLLLAAYAAGLIQPHGVLPAP